MQQPLINPQDTGQKGRAYNTLQLLRKAAVSLVATFGRPLWRGKKKKKKPRESRFMVGLSGHN